MRAGAFLFLLTLSLPAAAAEHWVSPDAKGGGDGSRAHPFTLSEALSQPRNVAPGDTIWLLGGVYRGTFVSTLRGSRKAPIIVRQAPGARATLDGGDSNGKAILAVSGRDTWFWGFEITSSDPKRQSAEDVSWPSDIPRGEGVQIVQKAGSGVGVKLIDLVIHDARQGISFWADAEDAEAEGCLIYFNGWDGARGRGHGHGMYVQNKGGTKKIANNVVFDQFGGGIQAFGSEKAFLDNLEIVGNTIFNSGALSKHGNDRNLLLGGGRRARNARIVANATWYADGSANNLGYQAGCENALVADNVFAAGGSNPALSVVNCGDGLEMRGNTFLGQVTGFTPPRGNAVLSRGRGVKVLVRKDAYDDSRAVVTVFNWDREKTVAFDPASVLSKGSAYELRNAQDFYGPPVLSGTWDGRPLALPMNGLKTAQPVGWPAPPPTGPEFNVFILLSEEPQPQVITLSAEAKGGRESPRSRR
jgi:hypothetical protein